MVVGFPIDEGVLGFQTKYPAGIVSPAYGIWKLKNETECHIPYLERFLRSPHARSLYASRMQGAVARRRSLTKSDFLNLEIPFPPLDDQIRIAYLLGKVEGLIAQRKQHLQQLYDLLKSVFLEMFGDTVRNENGWDVLRFSELFAIPPKIGTTKPASGDVGIPVVRVGEIGGLEVRFDKCATVELNIDEYSKCKVEVGDILLARAIGSQEQLGKASLITKLDRPIAFDSHVMRIRFDPERVVPLFAYFWLRSSGGRALFLKASGKTSVQFNINAKQISSIRMPLPPKPIQDEFATFVEKIEALMSRYQQSLTDLEALYGALRQHAFKGELDLSRVPLPADQGNLIHGEQFEQQASRSSLPVEMATPTEVINKLAQAAQPQERGEMLARWFSRHLANTSPDASLGSAQFLEAAWQTLQETQLEDEEETPALTLDDYNALKDWVFKALASGELNQSFDADSNRVTLQKRAANLGTC